jgi:uncharacterized repeat protein (TIGR01451 family)
MDKTEHGSWPFNVTKLAGDISFASEPVVADLDNDGRAEVIFGSWPRNGGRRVGKIVVTDWQGNLLQQIALPAPRDTDVDSWNGVLGAPTLANIDADPDLELVVGTVSSGIVAYDLPGSANARVLWGAGRGSFLRTGAQSPPTSFSMSARVPIRPGDTVGFKLILSDPIAPPLLALQLTDSLPSGLTFVPGSLTASSGTPSESSGAIKWSGTLRSGKPITIAFKAQVSAAISSTTVLINQAKLSGSRSATFRSTLIVKGQAVWLPTLRR